jgi:hypothetical protein
MELNDHLADIEERSKQLLENTNNRDEDIQKMQSKIDLKRREYESLLL